MGILYSREKPKRSQQASKVKWLILMIFVLAILAGSLDYPRFWDKAADYLNSQAEQLKLGIKIPHFYKLPFRLGLDLQGGTHLVYQANLSDIEEKERQDSMEGIRDVIERRVNLFGVAEPLIQINKVKDSYRLIVELPGVKDIHQAISMIGETPYLEFKEERSQEEIEDILKRLEEAREEGDEDTKILDPFKSTLLTGRYLKKAQLEFDQTTYEPQISLEFNDEGAEFFGEITKRNVGKRVAIYLDGYPISTPVVQESITGGRAQITGDFTLDEAKKLVQRLNAGALPVPIILISQQSVGASLGEISLAKSLKAILIGLIAVALFMIFYYRLLGVLAVIALAIYTIIILAIFKLIPVTLTLAGIAGFILSVGMAVDANVLIFERMREELKSGKSLGGSISDGFKRAWPSIRDGNISTLITAIILFWFGTSVIKGFALTLFFGVLTSMFTAIVITKTFLKLFVGGKIEKLKWLYGHH
jgi:protein-export membrane protein SecD